METITSLDSLIRSTGFQNYESDKLGNDLFINDPERASRIHDAAEHGIDGSTHQEHIDDWRDYLATLGEDDISDETRETITRQIDDCEQWHRANGSLEQTGA